MKDLLKVHKLMMGGLVDGAGALRTGQVGVFNGAERARQSTLGRLPRKFRN